MLWLQYRILIIIFCIITKSVSHSFKTYRNFSLLFTKKVREHKQLDSPNSLANLLVMLKSRYD